MLRLWAGSPGYDIDKIVVTDDPRTDWRAIPALNCDTPADSIGRPATQGSATRAACDPCNPIYGLSVTPEQCTGYPPVLTPTNHLANPLFGGYECADDPVYNFPYENDPDFDCVVYYSGQALRSDVIVYTIGLGNGARGDLLQMAAETARGQYFFAPAPEDLDAIFDAIVANAREAACGPNRIYLPIIFNAGEI